ncbi:hypothetical protein NM688_g729 [Phlebia brevispora]|uniref:Uncharacterized protein n=1 Tax=Phlebia brevispora TaxID=194682 RepID=A0ACC1TDD6_9APHY|nr:hypothetical protein NM688_g729 [Phlebia brevispora]
MHIRLKWDILSLDAYHPHADIWQERAHIRSLAPLEGLPLTLVPTRKSPRPPILRYAWVFTETAKERLMRKAEERGILRHKRRLIFPPDYDENDPDLYPAEEIEDGVDEPLTMELAACALLKDIGVKLPVRHYVTTVSTPTDPYAAGLTLYTNYEFNKRPTDEDIEKIRSYLGFTDEPNLTNATRQSVQTSRALQSSKTLYIVLFSVTPLSIYFKLSYTQPIAHENEPLVRRWRMMTIPYFVRATIHIPERSIAIYKPAAGCSPVANSGISLYSVPRTLQPCSAKLDSLKIDTRTAIVHYAWLIDDDVRIYLLEEAEKRGLLCYGYRLSITDVRELSIPFDQKTEEPDVDEDSSMERVVEDIIREMRLKRWTEQYINFVLLPDKCNVLALTVCTSHELLDSPSDEVVERLRTRFGFTGTPRWYPDSLSFQWVQ